MIERAEIVVILAKEPKPGLVKTRLQSRFTVDEAAQLPPALRDTERALRLEIILGALIAFEIFITFYQLYRGVGH